MVIITEDKKLKGELPELKDILPTVDEVFSPVIYKKKGIYISKEKESYNE